MSTTKHTPGSWEPIKLNSAPLGPWAVNAPGYGGKSPLVCALEYSKGGPILHAESEANARLIAASPDLLDALQNTVNHWSAQFERRGHLAPDWCKQARAAIAKATGEQP